MVYSIRDLGRVGFASLALQVWIHYFIYLLKMWQFYGQKTMEYIGKKVFHKSKYGEGTIVSEDPQGYIFVKFQSEEQEKKFPVPKCFASHLQLIDKMQKCWMKWKKISMI